MQLIKHCRPYCGSGRNPRKNKKYTDRGNADVAQHLRPLKGANLIPDLKKQIPGGVRRGNLGWPREVVILSPARYLVKQRLRMGAARPPVH